MVCVGKDDGALARLVTYDHDVKNSVAIRDDTSRATK